MARRSGFVSTLIKTSKAIDRANKAQHRANTQAARAAERAQAAYERSMAQAAKYGQLEQKRLYLESRNAEVALQNEELEEAVAQLNNLLGATLGVDDYFDLQRLKKQPEYPLFDTRPFGSEGNTPNLSFYEIPEPTGLKRFLPGTKDKHAQAVAEAQARYEKDLATFNRRKAERKAEIDKAREEHDRRVDVIRGEVDAQNLEIDQFQRELEAGSADAVINYFSLVLEASEYPEDFPQHAKIAYVPESKQLVVEYDLPPFSIVPEVATFKYQKAKDEITSTARPLTQRKALYASIVAQVTLRTIHELFEADRLGHLETIVFSGFVDSIDPGTGRETRTCVVTVRTTRDTFSEIDLARVEPQACLKKLNAAVSKSPAELSPVRPVLEFNMVDPRFIQETDVLSGLDQRTNLMDLSPGEFEGLISNLFRSMGLETRLTQASRDGGVDCVAYDPRPIFGGKVVIQAKRYKHTVGVSAVRDLFGTVQNEGASKGILVTTSGFGKAAFDFAEGKPLELLSGSHLLHLLAEHAGLEAKIEMPETWVDPVPDAPGA